MKLLTKIIVITLILTNINIFAGETDELKKIEHVLNKLKIALNEHKFEIIEPFLDENFSYSSYTGEMATYVMRQIVVQYPHTIAAINIKEQKEIATGYEIWVEIDTGEKVENKSILISDNFKILKAEIVSIQMHGSTNSSNEDHNSGENNFPEETIIPFELAGRLITVEAEISGIKGKFLVDSGAGGFWVDKKAFPRLLENAETVSSMPSGAGGKTSGVFKAEADNFRLGGIKIPSADVLIGDLSRFSREYNMNIIGIIGSDFLHKFTVVFDYKRKELTMLNEDGQIAWEKAPDLTVDYKMKGHLPIIETEIEGSKLKFGLDCGAETAMLFSSWEEKLKEHYTFLKINDLKGIDGNTQQVKKIELQQFRVGQLEFNNHSFIIGDLQLNHKAELDGLLGYEFLSQYKSAVNFPERKIYFWKQ